MSSAPSILLEAARDYWRDLDEAARAAFRFIHVSTDEVYGSLGENGLFREDTPYAPNSPYSASKAAADHLARAWHHTYGLPVIITNCSNNYGPCQFPEKLIPLMIINALAGRDLPVYGRGREPARLAACRGSRARPLPGAHRRQARRPSIISAAGRSAAISRWCARSAPSSIAAGPTAPARASA